MDAIKKQKISSDGLVIGMYVTELDIPWLDSPFLLQGFLIETQEEILKLQKVCAYVYIDRTKSLGRYHRSLDTIVTKPVQKKESIFLRILSKTKKSSNTDVVVKPSSSKKNAANNDSFYDVMNRLSAQQNGHITRMEYVGDKDKLGVNAKSQDIGLVDSLLGTLFGAREVNTKQVSVQREFAQYGYSEKHALAHTDDFVPVEEEIVRILPAYEKSSVATKNIFEAVASEKNIDLSNVNEVVDSMVESVSKAPEALLWLTKLKANNLTAYEQALNVSVTMMAFANFLAYPKETIKDMGLAGLLQDLGKAKIPEVIINKKTRLKAAELRIMQSHVEESLEILEKTPNIPKSILKIVSEHHERVDGSGYPLALKKDQLKLTSQVSGLIDTYCAMTTLRSHAQAMYNQQALDEIHKMSGTKFTTDLIEQLVQFLGIYPVSSLVELNSGEVAVVIQQNTVRRLLPRVMVLLDSNKVKYSDPPTLDLLLAPLNVFGEPYEIVRGVQPAEYNLNASEFFESEYALP